MLLNVIYEKEESQKMESQNNNDLDIKGEGALLKINRSTHQSKRGIFPYLQRGTSYKVERARFLCKKKHFWGTWKIVGGGGAVPLAKCNTRTVGHSLFLVIVGLHRKFYI